MHVVSLHIHPIKGSRAVGLDGTQLGERGLDGDRRWLAVDAAGTFATQRSHSRLATITATPTANGLRLSAPGASELTVATPSGRERADVTIWADPVSAALADAPAHAWLSTVLGDEMRLVHMDDDARRMKSGVWVETPVPVSFADAYPVLVVTTGSLAALNAEIERQGDAAVPMARFRPNIVVACDDAWREDTWKTLRVGRTEMALVKPCDRCVVTTKDPATGETLGDEPLASLRRLRMSDDPRVKGVLFGWNATPLVRGAIAVDDRVEVLEQRPEGFPIRRL